MVVRVLFFLINVLICDNKFFKLFGVVVRELYVVYWTSQNFQEIHVLLKIL